jgi:hypothetical protein
MSKWSSAFRDSRWQKLRLRVMERDKWRCKACGKGDGDGVVLNVHHAYYTAGTSPWEYPLDSLVTYCEDCHTQRHAIQKRILSAMANTSTLGILGIALISERFFCVAENFGNYDETFEPDEAYPADLDCYISEIAQDALQNGVPVEGGVK